MKKILITGATGFIGSAVVARLSEMNIYEAVALVRKPLAQAAVGVSVVQASIDGSFKWPISLRGIDCVVHCAGRAHMLNDDSNDPLAEFRKVNVDGTIALAREAAAAGVERFIFISSIGVNGSESPGGAFVENALPAPSADYAVSKLEAERGLMDLQTTTPMEIVIIRPPLVYAANAPGNFQRLLRLVHTRVPLPLAGVDNHRSMIALENLVDFIVRCIDHPAAANELFLIADDEDLSTEKIVRILAQGMGFSKVILFPYPDNLVRLIARLAAKQGLYSQLYRSLTVDASKAHRVLGWRPEISAEVALQNAGRGYKDALD